MGERKLELTLYERLAFLLRKFFPKKKLPEEFEKNLRAKIDFCGLMVEPYDVVNVSLFVSFLVLTLVGALLYLKLNLMVVLSVALIGGVVVFFLFNFPNFYEKYIRIRANTDLLLCILYMIISLQFSPNLERAVSFAAASLGGPIGRDLQIRLWRLEAGVYRDVEELLEDFSRKWERENKEFVEAIELIKSSLIAPSHERKKMYDEALRLLIERNEERLKSYGSELKSSSMLITYLGILLPMLTTSLLPILTIFLAKSIDPYSLIFVYDVTLPIVLSLFIFYSLQKRPLTFGSIDIREHPEATRVGYFLLKVKDRRVEVPLAIPSLLLGLPVAYLGWKNLMALPADTVLLEHILYSLLVVFGVVLALLVFSFFSYFKNLRIERSIRTVEEEASEAFYTFGEILKRGYSVESCMRKLVDKTKRLKISGLFGGALNLMVSLGYTFERAFFDKDYGVLKLFPSKLIKNIFKLVCESLKKGMERTSYSLLIISEYLRGFWKVEQYFKDIMEETTSEIRFMLEYLLPISIGVTIGIAAIATLMVYELYSYLSAVFHLQKELPFAVRGGFLTIIADVNKIIPVHFFVIAMGIYLIQNTFLLSWYYSSIVHGEDKLELLKVFSAALLKNFLIFSAVSLATFLMMSGMIPRMGG